MTSLAAIVTIDPAYAREHQLIVIDCLEDPDETLRRKTLDLLYTMTNAKNVMAIVDRLLKFLETSTDNYLRRDLVARLAQLAEKFAPDTEWYVQTMTTVLELGGDLVRPELTNALLRLIATAGSSGAEDDEDEALGSIGADDTSSIDGTRQRAVDTYITRLQSGKPLPDAMLKVMVWILGEYGHLSATTPPEGILSLLVSAYDRVVLDPSVKAWIVTAMQSLVAHTNVQVSNEVLDVITRAKASLSVDQQQRAHEFAELIKDRQLMSAVLPINGHAEKVTIDVNLGFLNAYVQQALAAGAKPYQSQEQLAKSRAESERARQEHKQLRYEEYAKPTTNIVTNAVNKATPQYFTETGLSIAEVVPTKSTTATANAPAGGGGAKVGLGDSLKTARRVWGPKGFNDPKQEQQQQQLQQQQHQQQQQQQQQEQDQQRQQQEQQRQKDEQERLQQQQQQQQRLSGASNLPVNKPRVLTQKELSAQSLFAGVGATASAPSRPAFVTPAAARLQQQQQQQQHLLPLLL